MVKKYFCDYCSTRFAYSPEAWRRHVRGVTHVRARAEHYRQLSSPRELLRSEQARRPCRRRGEPGGCPFGDSCVFSHLSQEEVGRLRAAAHAEEAAQAQPAPPPTLESWLAVRPHLARLEGGATYRWQPPPGVRQVAEVAPSLRVVEVTLSPSQVAEWG